MSAVTSHYHMLDWQETTAIEGSDGCKLTRVDAAFRYQGTINGETTVCYQMFYETETTGFYEGFELFRGTHEGADASVRFRHRGSFDATGVDARIETVAGTGTGPLSGRRLCFTTRFEGEGRYPITIGEE